jgi:hypothetical protein
MSVLSKIRLTVVQWLVVMLAAVTGVLALAFKLQGDKLKEVKLKLMEKDLDLAIKKDSDNIKEKKKKLREAKRK